MNHPYGVDPAHPAADLLTAALRERYGSLARLERERFRLVNRCDTVPAGPPVVTPEQGDANATRLAIELDRHDREVA